MRPSYSVAIFIILLIVGEYFWKNKQVSAKDIMIILVGAMVAGICAALLVEAGLGLFRLFMSASAGEGVGKEHSLLLAMK